MSSSEKYLWIEWGNWRDCGRAAAISGECRGHPTRFRWPSAVQPTEKEPSEFHRRIAPLPPESYAGCSSFEFCPFFFFSSKLTQKRKIERLKKLDRVYTLSGLPSLFYCGLLHDTQRPKINFFMILWTNNKFVKTPTISNITLLFYDFIYPIYISTYFGSYSEITS